MSLPWERQPGETNKQYGAFALYRDMGINRSLVKLRLEVEKKWGKKGKGYEKMLQRWSSKNHWQARVKAYDGHVEEERRLKLEKVRAESMEQHIQITKNVFNALAVRFNELTKNEEWEQLAPEDMLKEMREFIKLERMMLGMPTDITKTETTNTVKLAGNDTEPSELMRNPEFAEMACKMLDMLEMGTTELKAKKEAPVAKGNSGSDK